MFHKLEQNAIFIADSHYPNHKSKEFLALLENIKNKKVKTSQLILMGDIFDLLVGNSFYLKKRFSNEIKLLEEIAKEIEVIYLEGNHDFYLKHLFKKIKIIPIDKQPFLMEYQNKIYALSHGDNTLMPLKYKIYSKIIRVPIILKILPDIIAKIKLKQMKKKDICTNIKDFKIIASKKSALIKADFIIEGHFHQEKIIKNYISLPSFACSAKIGVFTNQNILFKISF